MTAHNPFVNADEEGEAVDTEWSEERRVSQLAQERGENLPEARDARAYFRDAAKSYAPGGEGALSAAESFRASTRMQDHNLVTAQPLGTSTKSGASCLQVEESVQTNPFSPSVLARVAHETSLCTHPFAAGHPPATSVPSLGGGAASSPIAHSAISGGLGGPASSPFAAGCPPATSVPTLGGGAASSPTAHSAISGGLGGPASSLFAAGCPPATSVPTLGGGAASSPIGHSDTIQYLDISEVGLAINAQVEVSWPRETLEMEMEVWHRHRRESGGRLDRMPELVRHPLPNLFTSHAAW